MTLPPLAAATAFQGLARDVYLATAARHPGWATAQGLRDFDGMLPDPSAEAFAEEVRELDAFLGRLEATEVAPTERVDAAALRYHLTLRRFEVARLAKWRRNPDFALEVLDHVFPLLARPFAPLPERLAAIAERLEAAPRYLARARARIDRPAVPPLWLDIAVESVEAAPALLDAVLEAAREARLEADAMGRLTGAVEAARAALDEHARWLRTDVAPVAAGSWGIGEELFDEMLRARLVPQRARDLVRLGERLVAEHEAALRETAGTVVAAAGHEPSGDVVAAARRVVHEDHPADFHAVLLAYRRACTDARAFLEKQGLLTLPAGERVEIVETPAYLRHIIPFAAYMQPGRFEPEPVGIYLVTPKVDLSAFAHADIRNVTTHEAYPGHHAQLVLANTHPSLARALVEAVETIEGWALYCEEVMGRHGFTADPRERFVRVKDALFRALRVRLDPALHLGLVSFEEAVVALRDGTGMSSEEAEAEVKRYTLEPGYNFSYMWGKLGILDLRNEWEAAGTSERAFHDAVARAGSLPLALLRDALEDVLRAPPAR